jgi:hypothetical protein
VAGHRTSQVQACQRLWVPAVLQRAPAQQKEDSTVDREKLIKRLRYLWTWELLDSFLLPAIAAFCSRIVQQPMGLFAIYGAGLVSWILWQGAAYWWLRLRTVRTGIEVDEKHLQWFAVLKKVNWALIAALPVLLVVIRSAFDLVAGLGFYTLAILEQINYYHYQLMYDQPSDWQHLVTHKRLRRSSLSRALDRAKD